MEQRPLRLGDLVDDYCPRERRLTNHAIVAIVEDEIRQTRCSTCDAEHVYKGGKAPMRKKKDPTAKLYEEVLANVTGQPAVMAAAVEPTPPPAVVASAVEPAPPAPAPEAAPAPDEGWTLHRTLIRASLPRTDTPAPRPIPEFTMHQRNVRGSHVFRNGGTSHGSGNGFDRQNGHGRSGFPPHGDGQPGAPNGQRPGGGRRRRRHKKSRPAN